MTIINNIVSFLTGRENPSKACASRKPQSQYVGRATNTIAPWGEYVRCNFGAVLNLPMPIGVGSLKRRVDGAVMEVLTTIRSLCEFGIDAELTTEQSAQLLQHIIEITQESGKVIQNNSQSVLDFNSRVSNKP